MSKAAEVKKAIYDAVWEGQINQITTREVAEKFGCSIRVARRHLLDIVNEMSGDDRFEFSEPFYSVKVKGGNLFTYGFVDMQGNPTTDENPLRHYVWFLT